MGVDVDIRKFFDTIPKQQLRAVLRQRIGDGVIDRLIGKWLKAGIWEAGGDLPGSRHAARIGDLTAPEQRLPARGAGCLVRA